jgi:hypothetical protein
MSWLATHPEAYAGLIAVALVGAAYVAGRWLSADELMELD